MLSSRPLHSGFCRAVWQFLQFLHADPPTLICIQQRTGRTKLEHSKSQQNQNLHDPIPQIRRRAPSQQLWQHDSRHPHFSNRDPTVVPENWLRPKRTGRDGPCAAVPPGKRLTGHACGVLGFKIIYAVWPTFPGCVYGVSPVCGRTFPGMKCIDFETVRLWAEDALGIGASYHST